MPVELDLDRLNATERAILRLLAQGHTAKSIAFETGRSEGAVNERLREARRKTGVGSSRELARLLRDQENVDEQIGVATPEPAAAVVAGAPIRAWLTGVLAMTIILAALAAAALRQSSPARPAKLPLYLAAAAPHYGDAESWHYETQAQQRNPAWADAHEAVLRRRYAAIPGIDRAALRIDCRESKCEVIGRSTTGASAATLKRAVDELESPAMRSSLAADGLHADFTNWTGDASTQIAFLAYWVSPDD